jgi:hypothetical protein
MTANTLRRYARSLGEIIAVSSGGSKVNGRSSPGVSHFAPLSAASARRLEFGLKRWQLSPLGQTCVGEGGLEPAVVWLIDRYLVNDGVAQSRGELRMIKSNLIVAQTPHQRPE